MEPYPSWCQDFPRNLQSNTSITDLQTIKVPMQSILYNIINNSWMKQLSINCIYFWYCELFTIGIVAIGSLRKTLSNRCTRFLTRVYDESQLFWIKYSTGFQQVKFVEHNFKVSSCFYMFLTYYHCQ